MIRKVLVIFKTHLDIGYTDLAHTVRKQYLEDFIPKAIETAYRQKDTDCPFLWTTGSYLIREALEYDRDGSVERAIRDGLICWHALPCTTHTEYMNQELFRYGLEISQELDRRFGRHTIAAKMSDVPGHTIAMVPELARAGVELLHIGVNPATPVPPVPEIFRWQYGDDSILMMYNGGGYGKTFEVGETAVVFGVTNDNLGPQGGSALKTLYDELRAQYPGAEVTAATLNDVADAVRGMEFPVVTQEIGDSWIHGVGTDPIKNTLYRSVLRQAKELREHDLRNSLLMVPEHTWGMCLQRYFPNTTDYLPDEMERAEGRERFASSWAEQREYVNEAAKELGVDLSEDRKVECPDVSGMRVTDARPRADVSYQLFDRRDYERYFEEYVQIDDEWAHWDFLKPGIPEYQGGIFEPKQTGAWTDGKKTVFRMEFEEKLRTTYGLPTVYLIEEDGMIEARWFGKRGNRLPEAFWIKLNGLGEGWELEKMGRTVKPENVLGNPHLHSVFSVSNANWKVENLDAPLAAPFGRHLLRWKAQTEVQDLYFNLYNNIWNTNFPMWFDEDARFRFRITAR